MLTTYYVRYPDRGGWSRVSGLPAAGRDLDVPPCGARGCLQQARVSMLRPVEARGSTSSAVLGSNKVEALGRGVGGRLAALGPGTAAPALGLPGTGTSTPSCLALALILV
jgi:hypothetical protein